MTNTIDYKAYIQMSEGFAFRALVAVVPDRIPGSIFFFIIWHQTALIPLIIIVNDRSKRIVKNQFNANIQMHTIYRKYQNGKKGCT